MNQNDFLAGPSIYQYQQQRALVACYVLCSGLGIFGLILLTSVTWFKIFRPMQNDFQRIQQEQLEALSLRQSELDILDELKRAQGQAHIWRLADAHRQQRSSPDQDDAAFLKWLNQQATYCGLTVRDFRPLGREQHVGYVSRGITISASGSYQSVCQFLDQLRMCPRMNRVTSLEITPRDDLGSEFHLNLQGRLFTHLTSAISTQSQGG